MPPVTVYRFQTDYNITYATSTTYDNNINTELTQSDTKDVRDRENSNYSRLKINARSEYLSLKTRDYKLLFNRNNYSQTKTLQARTKDLSFKANAYTNNFTFVLMGTDRRKATAMMKTVILISHTNALPHQRSR